MRHVITDVREVDREDDGGELGPKCREVLKTQISILSLWTDIRQEHVHLVMDSRLRGSKGPKSGSSLNTLVTSPVFSTGYAEQEEQGKYLRIVNWK